MLVFMFWVPKLTGSTKLVGLTVTEGSIMAQVGTTIIGRGVMSDCLTLYYIHDGSSSFNSAIGDYSSTLSVVGRSPLMSANFSHGNARKSLIDNLKSTAFTLTGRLERCQCEA